MKAMPIRTNDPSRGKKTVSAKSVGFGESPIANILAPGGQLGVTAMPVPPPSSYQTMGTSPTPSNILPSPVSTSRGGGSLRVQSQKTVERQYQHNPCIRVSDAPYQITVKDKMRYHAITMMKVR